MTVRRRRRTIIEGSPRKVAAAIEHVISAEGRYRSSRQSADGTTWVVIVRPSWWMLPASLRASVAASPNGNAELVVTTKSQSFVWGDVFREYDRQIDRFIEEVESAVAGTA